MSTSIFKILLAIPFLLLSFATAEATDGVEEINHTRAVQTEHFSGDSTSDPVTIDGQARRSYRLTSDLIVPNENTDGIVVSTISIDLNNFEIVHSGCEGATTNCTPNSGVASMASPPHTDRASRRILSDALRMELAPQGIQVALLEPASIATEIWDKGTEAAKPYEESAPEGFAERYGKFLAGIQKFAAKGKERAHPPQVVPDAVIHALESSKPKTRYIMGDDAGQRKFLRRLPDRLRDKRVLTAFGI